jgi:hypothetical protein
MRESRQNRKIYHERNYHKRQTCHNRVQLIVINFVLKRIQWHHTILENRLNVYSVAIFEKNNVGDKPLFSRSSNENDG